MTDVSDAGRTRTSRERSWAVAAALVAALAVAGYFTWRHFARPVDPRYEQLIHLLVDDPSALPADGRGRVDLTARFPGFTPRDEAFVVRRPDRSFLVLFPNFYGKGLSMAGLLYTSRPFQPGDTYVRQSALGSATPVIDLGSYRHTTIDDRIDDHWFHVSYAMH